MNSKPYQNKGIIRPVKRKSDPAIGPDLIMAMISSDLDTLVKKSGARKLPFSETSLYGLYQAENRSEETFTLTGPFLGAPQAVIGMEKMIALGAKRIRVLGYCGSLHPDLRIGDLIIPMSAFSEEGTSLHYPIGEREKAADERLSRVIEETLKKREQPFRKGAVWTTDAPYRETPVKIKAYQDEGVLAVEMEMSALMTVAIYRGVRLAGLLVVSDELFDLNWHPGFSSPRLKESSRLAVDILLSTVERLED